MILENDINLKLFFLLIMILAVSNAKIFAIMDNFNQTKFSLKKYGWWFDRVKSSQKFNALKQPWRWIFRYPLGMFRSYDHLLFSFNFNVTMFYIWFIEFTDRVHPFGLFIIANLIFGSVYSVVYESTKSKNR